MGTNEVAAGFDRAQQFPSESLTNSFDNIRMANPLVVVDVALLFAAFGVKLCYTQLFSSTPVSEGAKLAAYGEKLWECRKKAQKAWRQAKAAIAFAERLVRHGADPIEISRVNSKAVSFSEEAERANEKAFLFKKTIIKHIAYMKKKFGDLESTRRAVDESGVLVAMAESFRDEQENQSDELMRNMGIQNW